MLVQEMEHFSASKARINSVVRTAPIEIETSAASAVRDACSRGMALHLSAASDRKFVKCVV